MVKIMESDINRLYLDDKSTASYPKIDITVCCYMTRGKGLSYHNSVHLVAVIILQLTPVMKTRLPIKGGENPLLC